MKQVVHVTNSQFEISMEVYFGMDLHVSHMCLSGIIIRGSHALDQYAHGTNSQFAIIAVKMYLRRCLSEMIITVIQALGW